MKKFFCKGLLLIMAGFAVVGCSSGIKYETVPNDMLNAKIYTLSNGLKVYMTVNKDEPRIQTYIAVKVGSKNDPAQTTGLAHYFEHLMFKGSEQFGTSNYAAEKPLLDKIEAKFEQYRTLTDPDERAAAYEVIDSLSYEASKYSIANEYDKLMAAIGARGTNAYTWFDMTVYQEDIPSNQIDAWAKIQSDRFAHNVIRGFHTELETVYEEKNMSLTKDGRRAFDAFLSLMFPHHPYGTQTTLGTQEHLKNPSITNIKEYYKSWYVPNNMAICLSGDFNPDSMVVTIEKYFGQMKPNDNLPKLQFEPEKDLTEPVEQTIVGQEAPFVMLGWRMPATNSEKTPVLTLLAELLTNGKTGLIDVNVNQAQKVLGAGAQLQGLSDYSALIMQANPKQGQTLQEVKDILLEQIELLKKGEFDENLIPAIINNYKKYFMENMEYNSARADYFVSAFINNVPWQQEVEFLSKMAALTKQDVVNAANEFLTNGYVVVNKEQGVNTNDLKMAKPKITPILTNRDKTSDFLAEIQKQAANAKPIEPVFLDFNKDLSKLTAKQNIEVLYKQNVSNDLFELDFIIDKGYKSDKYLPSMINYFSYLGTNSKTLAQINNELYQLACSAGLSTSSDRTYFYVEGLSENMEAALKILEDKALNVKADDKVLENLKLDLIKRRNDAKKSQSSCFSNLNSYIVYGKENPSNYVLSDEQIKAMTSDMLLNGIKDLLKCEQYVVYYGPEKAEKVIEVINNIHNTPSEFTPVDKKDRFIQQVTKENKVFIAPYDSKQIYMIGYSCNGGKLNVENTPVIDLYNEYFGGGMNSIVFQEMREARGLAYSASARYNSPSDLDKFYSFTTFIATQNDKMMDAIGAFEDIINNMPVSEGAFKIAKDGMIANIRSNRVLKSNVLWSYINAKKMGLDYDINKLIFDKAQNLTLDDVVKFQQENVKDRVMHIGILGDEKDLDMKTLGNGQHGKIERLSLKDIFGY